MISPDVASIINSFLKVLKQDNSGQALNFNWRSGDGQTAISIMNEYQLIRPSDSTSPAKLRYITPEGEAVLNENGIENYLLQKDNASVIKTHLEDETRKYTMLNVKSIYENRHLTFWIAVVAFLVSLFDLAKILF